MLVPTFLRLDALVVVILGFAGCSADVFGTHATVIKLLVD